MARRHLDNGWLGQYVSGAKRGVERVGVKLTIANASRNRVNDLTNRQIRARERNIANAYFSQAPTISNLYNGVRHWITSKVTPNNDKINVRPITGDVPTPNSLKNIGNNVKTVANTAKTVKNAINWIRDAGTVSKARAVANTGKKVVNALSATERISPNVRQAVTQNTTPGPITLRRKTYVPPVSRRKLKYVTPTTTPNANARDIAFRDYLENDNIDNMVATVAREQHIPESVVLDHMSRFGLGDDRATRAFIMDELGARGANDIGLTFNDRITDHFADQLNRLSDYADRADAAFYNVGLNTPNVRRVAANMRYSGNPDDAIRRTVDAMLDDPNRVYYANNIRQAIDNSKGAQEFMARQGITSNELYRLLGLPGFNLYNVDNFANLDSAVDAYLRNLGTTSPISRLLRLDRRSLASMPPGSVSNGDLNFIFQTGRELHPNLPRGRYTKREMAEMVNRRINAASLPQEQYGIRELLDSNFSADSAHMIINSATKLVKRSKAACLYT